MKKNFSMNSIVTKVDANTIRVALVVVSLVLFILGAGAPDAGGGIVHAKSILNLGF